jgi:hypothetical protein
MNGAPARARGLKVRRTGQPPLARALAGLAIAFVALAVSLPTTPTDAATAAAPMAFGIFASSTKTSSVQTVESQVARSFAYIRVYRRWNDTFPDTDISWMKSTGHSLFLSIKPMKDGANVSCQAIADSQLEDTSALNAYKTMADDPFFSGVVT